MAPLAPGKGVDAAAQSDAQRLLWSAALTGPYEQSVALWPKIRLPFEAFVAFVQQRCEEGSLPHDALAGLHIGDLYLTAACLGGDREAHAIFLQLCNEIQPSSSGSLRLETSDISQMLFQRMLLPDDAEPARLLQYTGKGALKSWLRVASVRLRATLSRKKMPDVVDSEVIESLMLAAEGSPETSLVTLHCGDDVKKALAKVIAQMPSRARNVLRMSLSEGLSIDAIGEAYDVHRATAARWLTDIRESVSAGLRTELKNELALSTLDAQSVLREALDKLDATLLRHLKKQLDEHDDEERASR